MKELFIDTETTGISPQAGIWQIAGIIRIDGEVKEEFDLKCDIFEDDVVEPEAMSMANMTTKDLSKLPDPAETYESLIKILERYVDRYDKRDKFQFIGYGAEYDAKALRRWFEGFGDHYFGSWFWHPWICVMTLAAYAMRETRFRMPNFKLGTVLDYAGIKVADDRLHDALYDIRQTLLLYDHLTGGPTALGDPKKPGQKIGEHFQYMEKGRSGKRQYKINNNGSLSRRRA